MATGWKSTLSYLEKLDKLTSTLNDYIAIMDFDAYRTLFSECVDDDGIRHIRQELDTLCASLPRIMSILSDGISFHKSKNVHTQKGLNRTFLRILLLHVDEAYRVETGRHIARSYPETAEWPYKTPPWLFRLVRLIDGSNLIPPGAVNAALQSMIKERNAASNNSQETYDMEGAVFKWGSRRLVVDDVFHDAVGCDILDGMNGETIGYVEVLFSELVLFERVPPEDEVAVHNRFRDCQDISVGEFPA